MKTALFVIFCFVGPNSDYIILISLAFFLYLFSLFILYLTSLLKMGCESDGFSSHQWLQAFSQHAVLSIKFLEYIVSVLNRTPTSNNDAEKGEASNDSSSDENIQQAAILAVNAFFRFLYGLRTYMKIIARRFFLFAYANKIFCNTVEYKY